MGINNDVGIGIATKGKVKTQGGVFGRTGKA